MLNNAIAPKNTSSTKKNRFLVQMEMFAAPINPADIMNVKGQYPNPYHHHHHRSSSSSSSYNKENTCATRLQSPIEEEVVLDNVRGSGIFGHSHTVAGSEGWGQIRQILDTHSQSDPSTPTLSNMVQQQRQQQLPRLNVGDIVVPAVPGLGTWRTSMWLPRQNVIVIERGSELLLQQQQHKMSMEQIAPLFQTGGTAWRMLHDFVHLQSGDVILQNAGNSAVAIMISQIAASLNVKTISLVRRGCRSKEQYEGMVDYLTTTGKNTAVYAQEDLLQDKSCWKACMEQIRSLGSPPQLAMNAVGGESASLLIKLLGDGGTLVTYGGMSQQPVEVKTTHFIFRNIRCVGFWLSAWMVQQHHQAMHCSHGSTTTKHNNRADMMNQLVALVLDSHIECPPVQSFALDDYKNALEFESQQSNKAIRKKVVFHLRRQDTGKI